MLLITVFAHGAKNCRAGQICSPQAHRVNNMRPICVLRETNKITLIKVTPYIYHKTRFLRRQSTAKDILYRQDFIQATTFSYNYASLVTDKYYKRKVTWVERATSNLKHLIVLEIWEYSGIFLSEYGR